MVIVESQKEVEEFLNLWNTQSSIIIPIWSDLDKHPIHNELSFLYVRFGDSDFVVPFKHIDCQTPTIDLTTSKEAKWTINKKGLLQCNLGLNNLNDLQSDSFFQHNKLYPIGYEDQPFITHYTRRGIRDNLGKIAPIMKWGEYLRVISSTFTIGKENDWVSDTMIPLLSDIERFGVRVDREKFLDRWPQASKHLHDDTVYTQYNPYTITSRPSNRFGGINFSALNKSDGTREVFIPKPNNIFLQMDYDAYHPRIIGKLIGYELPKTSVHQWLADQYGCEYGEGKGITFQLLYGGIPEEFEEIPYYKGVKEFIEKLWEKSTFAGYLQTQHRRIPLDWIEGNNPQKLFNYLLQAMETELNMDRVGKILEFIKTTNIELSLYTYDSFLLSVPTNIDISIIKELKEIVEGSGFPIKAEWGTDYSKL
jgi:hypothetical protein